MIRISPDGLSIANAYQPADLLFLRGLLLVVLRDAEDGPEERLKFMALSADEPRQQFGIRVDAPTDSPLRRAPKLAVREYQFELPAMYENAVLTDESVGFLVLRDEGFHIICNRETQRYGMSQHLVNPVTGTIREEDRQLRAPMYREWKLHGRTTDRDWTVLAEWPRRAAKA